MVCAQLAELFGDSHESQQHVLLVGVCDLRVYCLCSHEYVIVETLRE